MPLPEPPAPAPPAAPRRTVGLPPYDVRPVNPPSLEPPALDALQVRLLPAGHPLLAPVLADLHRDYAARYPRLSIDEEMQRHPPAEFAPPDGAFLALLDGDEVVAAGAYRRYEPGTAELKRVWTSPRHRRRGLGRRVVEELERSARGAGYARVFLTTGPRQPEARALYLALGYAPVGDHDAIVASARAPLPFLKELAPVEDRPVREAGA